MYGVRRELEVDSIETKITKRSLQRIGHVLRMDNSRLAKQVTLGWPANREPTRKRNQTTIDFWRKIIKDAGIDPDLVESVALDRKKWRRTVHYRIEHLRDFECSLADRCPTTKKDQRDQISDNTECDTCGKICATRGGLKTHIRRMHRANREEETSCPNCQKTFSNGANRIVHMRTCTSSQEGVCPLCGVKQSQSNLARHKKKCQEKMSTTPITNNNDDRTTRVKYPCGSCEENVRGNSWAILCYDCKHWFHRKCTQYNVHEMKTLSKFRWHCGCKPAGASNNRRKSPCKLH